MIAAFRFQHAPADAAPPAPPAPAQAIASDGGIRVQASGGTPAQVYQGALRQRQELRRIREGLDQERRHLSESLQNPVLNGTDRQGLEARLRLVDSRIIALEEQITKSDALVANAAAMPGAIPPEAPRPYVNQDFAAVMTVILVVGVIVPIGIAHARRIWKRAGTAAAAIPQALVERFTRLEQNVDAIAIEVERISEGQRFMAKLSLDAHQREAEPLPGQRG